MYTPFLYILGRLTIFGEFLPFRPFVFYLCTLITGLPLIPVLLTLTGLSCMNIYHNHLKLLRVENEPWAM